MTSVIGRVYLAATLDLLAGWVASGTLGADAPRVVAEDEDEESEYVALMTAADLSAELLAGAGRRVVVVAEGPAATMRDVVAVHVDDDESWESDDDLGWYATQEIQHLLP